MDLKDRWRKDSITVKVVKRPKPRRIKRRMGKLPGVQQSEEANRETGF